jgi:hypothetical protein
MVGLFHAAVCMHALKPFSSTSGRQDGFMLNEHVMKVCQSPVDDCSVDCCGVEVTDLSTNKHQSLSLSFGGIPDDISPLMGILCEMTLRSTALLSTPHTVEHCGLCSPAPPCPWRHGTATIEA